MCDNPSAIAIGKMLNSRTMPFQVAILTEDYYTTVTALYRNPAEWPFVHTDAMVCIADGHQPYDPKRTSASQRTRARERD